MSPRSRVAIGWTALASAVVGSVAHGATPTVTFSTVSPTGYATGDINSVSISRNNLVTRGDYQYATYYGTDRYIYVARRTTAGTTPGGWQTRRLGSSTYQLPTTGATAITDDHNVIAMGIDGGGYMHLSWGMHNVPLNVAKSASPVDGLWDATNLTFNKLSSVTGLNEASATYPEFYNVPKSNDLLLFYRDGGAGGGSGNGNEYVNRYNAATGAWAQIASPLLRGVDPANPTASAGYNGYLNSVVYDSKNNLQMSWTWREDPNFQTNHDLMYAKSADNGATWTTQSGTPYVGAITKANAQVIKSIGQNNSLINNASMTVDQSDNPMIASWYAPKHATGNDTRQYMLDYFDGTDWKTSQITNRPTETITPNDATQIRETGRPIVLVDDANRVIVLMRYVEANNNGMTAAYSTDRIHWDFLTLSAADMGQYEPSYDPVLWETKNVLNLFYQPTALGASSAAVQVLQWDEKAFFASVPEPASLGLVGIAAIMLKRRRPNRSVKSPHHARQKV